MNRLLKNTLLSLSLLPFCYSAQAEEINVSNSVELQAALTKAEDNGQDDTIHLATGTYSVVENGNQTFSYFSEEGYGLALIGEGSENTVISGDRILRAMGLKSTIVSENKKMHSTAREVV